MASKDRPERPAKERMEPKFHVYVRLPFNRGDFVDPPPVNWDERKSEALWAIISGSQTDINWNELASRFDVTVEFLLQMVSYLTERHTSQLRAQMRKVAAVKGTSAPSPVPGAEPSGYPLAAEAMRRTGSVGNRAPSALSMRKDSPLPRNEGTRSPTPAKAGPSGRPQLSRNSSGGTAVAPVPSAKPPSRLSDPHRRRLSIITPGSATPIPQEADPSSPNPTDSARSTSPALSSSSSSSSSDAIESRIIRRPPRFQTDDGGGDLGDDDEAEPAFLPFKPKDSTSTASSGQDLGATLRGDARDGFGRRLPKTSGRSHRDQLLHHSQTSDSSTSSAAMVRRPTGDRKIPGPLSPRRTAELAGRSPSGNKGKSREGSDGTPSMGSSFSDLDDASVTQSALEEALASRMQDGTIGSRMSTLGHAIRSRYLPGGAGGAGSSRQ
ncbi:autophagy-related protein 29 [Naviculisporaceae sp. PSN 640]